jgi:hypothetical protein
MPQVTQFVGIDLHQDQVALAVLPEHAEACEPVAMLWGVACEVIARA